MRNFLRSASVLALGTAAIVASANPATYTLSGVGSGSLDGAAFTNTAFSIVATADTSAIFSPGPGLVNVVALTNTVTVTGMTSDAITDVIRVVDNQSASVAGLGDFTQDYAILFASNSAFSTYGLATSIGPLSGTPTFNAGNAFPTLRGTFVLNTVSSANFTAQVNPTPEPSALAAIGFGSLAFLRRRKRS